MELQTFLFWLIALITGLCAVAVVVAQNIVRAAAWLLFTLAGTAAIYFLLGADFVAATQLVVYVGGVLVLVVFGVMLTAQGPFIVMRTSPIEWAISTVVGLLFLGVLIGTITAESWPEGPKPVPGDPATSPSSVQLGAAFLGIEEVSPKGNISGLPTKRKNPPGFDGQMPPIERKRMGYLLPFEIVSVHLLVVLIGAAYLARAKRRRGSEA
jgi:NADH-quinone oxidoreductase subunit J